MQKSKGMQIYINLLTILFILYLSRCHFIKKLTFPAIIISSFTNQSK
jgi:hypothetical protein